MAEGCNELSENVVNDLSSPLLSTEPLVVVDTDKLHRTLQTVLKKQYTLLNDALESSLKDVANKMFEKGLISNRVKDSPTYDSVIHEFQAGMRCVKEITQLEEYCQKFLDCLYYGSQGGPAIIAAQNLAEEWKRDVQEVHSISLSLHCLKETQKQNNEMPKCQLQETSLIQSRSQKEEQVQCSSKAPSKTSTITEPQEEMQCAVTSQDKIQNVMKDLLEEQRYPLQVVLKDCLPQVAAEMFSKKLISQSVKDDPTFDKIIDEFVAGMKSKDIHELQDHLKSFLQILSNQCRPACDAAIHLMSELSDNEIFVNSEDIRNVKVNEEDKVLKELQRLQLQFAPLMTTFRNELKDKVKDKETLEELTDYVLIFIPMAKEDLSNIQDLNELFKKIHRYFDFLDCELIVEVAESKYISKELSVEIQKHSEQAANFRSSQSVKELRDSLLKIYNPYLKNPENAPKALIKLNTPWNQVNIDGLYLLIKHFLPPHEKQSLINHITISLP